MPQADGGREEAAGTLFVDQLGCDLTKDARAGRLGSVIGRQNDDITEL